MGRRLRFCDVCQRNVQPVKKFSVGWFLVLAFLTFGLGAFIYLIYYAARTPVDCPICGIRVIGNPPRGIQPKPVQPMKPVLQYCRFCGQAVTNPDHEYCAGCGQSLW
ncbi:MAG: hypothetical protein ACXADB_13505 [Candidatus Hermodarchaeia archaeon]|jgi:hypothetical protein